MACPICNGNIVKQVFYEPIYDSKFFLCECGIRYRVEYDLKKIFEQYDKDTQTRINALTGGMLEMVQQIYDRLVWAIPDIMTKKGDYLDLGCSIGVYPGFFKDKGWNVVGVEISEKSCKYAREKYGLDIINTNLEKIDFDSCLHCQFHKKFNLITAFEIIEHCQNPLGLLAKCYNWLKDDGVLMLSTPNVDSPSAHFRWAEGHHCGHLVLFGYERLVRILKDMGFEILDAGERAVYKNNLESMFLICKKVGYNIEHFDKEFFEGETGEKGGDRIRGDKADSLGILWGVGVILSQVFHNKSFIEVGCGIGHIIKHLQNQGESVCGVELSQYAVDHRLSDSKGNRLNIVQGDVRDLSFIKEKYDVAVCWNVLAYLVEEDIGKAVESLKQVVKEHIVLSISTTEVLKKRPHGYVGRKTIRPWLWWLGQFEKYGLKQDEEMADKINKLGGEDWRIFCLKKI